MNNETTCPTRPNCRCTPCGECGQRKCAGLHRPGGPYYSHAFKLSLADAARIAIEEGVIIPRHDRGTTVTTSDQLIVAWLLADEFVRQMPDDLEALRQRTDACNALAFTPPGFLPEQIREAALCMDYPALRELAREIGEKA